LNLIETERFCSYKTVYIALVTAFGSLTTVAEEALKPSSAELAAALREARSDPTYASLVQSKTKLAEEGKAHTQAVLNEIERGPGVGLIVDYSGLDSSSKVGMNFTPFGITKVDVTLPSECVSLNRPDFED
jgi:hypothetical protein